MKILRIVLPFTLLLAVITAAGCAEGPAPSGVTAQDGDTVVVHYVGTLDDGTQFDSSRDRGEPVEFVLGNEQMIPGFEDAIKGMRVGEVKTVTLSPDEAYGPYDDTLIGVVERAEIPSDIQLEIGLQLQLTMENGTVVIARVTEITEDTVTLDANPPLAGKELTFEIELVEIK